MSGMEADEGVAIVLLQRLEAQRLPRLLALKEKVGGGELLDDHEMTFLKEVIHDASMAKPFLDRNPQYKELAAQLFTLYKEITDQALENEKSL
jgi:hypothetical protein